MTLGASSRCRAIPGAGRPHTSVTFVTICLVLVASDGSTGEVEGLPSSVRPVLRYIFGSFVEQKR